MPNLSLAFKKIWFCRENPDSLKPTVHYYFNGINISQYLYTCTFYLMMSIPIIYVLYTRITHRISLIKRNVFDFVFADIL